LYKARTLMDKPEPRAFAWLSEAHESLRASLAAELVKLAELEESWRASLLSVQTVEAQRMVNACADALHERIVALGRLIGPGDTGGGK
jgi:hypothetical protein